MSELENIAKLVQKYIPRLEAIFGLSIWRVNLERVYPLSCLPQAMQEVHQTLSDKNYEEHCKTSKMVHFLGKIYVNPKFLGTIRDCDVVHELTHCLDSHNDLVPKRHIRLLADLKSDVDKFLKEGFAEFVSYEFPEIYLDERLASSARESQKQMVRYYHKYKECYAPYVKGYEFFKAVSDKIGKENILEIFNHLPQSIEEILNPEKYLERAGEQIYP